MATKVFNHLLDLLGMKVSNIYFYINITHRYIHVYDSLILHLYIAHLYTLKGLDQGGANGMYTRVPVTLHGGFAIGDRHSQVTPSFDTFPHVRSKG